MGTTTTDPSSTSSANGVAPCRATTVVVPFGRAKAATRSLLRLAAATVILTLAWTVLSPMKFTGGEPASLIVTIALALVIVPFGLVGVIMAISGLRWLAAACWPKPLGIEADATTLTLALGPFGTRRYDTARLDIRYPFELDDDEQGNTFEGLLPEERQIREFLPNMRHPDTRDSIDRVMLRFVDGTERDVAGALRPVLAIWRGETPARESSP